MVKWLRQLFTPKVVEVDLTRPRLDPEARKSLRDLKSHPGVNYIVARFRLQRWYLENEMRTRRFETLRELDQVQLGARWLAWAEKQIEDMLNVEEPKSHTADDEDIESFVKAQSALELVGQNQ